MACKPNVEMIAGGLKGIDVSGFDFDCDFL
jgi:hypothetical protein